MGATRYVERSDGSLRVERVYGDWMMRLLYGTRAGRFATGRWLVHPALSKVVGMWQDSPLSARRIGGFVQDYEIDMSEAVKPLAKFRTFNDFFTRKLRTECRPIDRRPEVFCAPADGLFLESVRYAD